MVLRGSRSYGGAISFPWPRCDPPGDEKERASSRLGTAALEAFQVGLSDHRRLPRVWTVSPAPGSPCRADDGAKRAAPQPFWKVPPCPAR